MSVPERCIQKEQAELAAAAEAFLEAMVAWRNWLTSPLAAGDKSGVFFAAAAKITEKRLRAALEATRS